jgi:antitoxin ParD1/3/4
LLNPVIVAVEEGAVNVSLTPRLEAMLREKVDSGMYNNASEVVREALRRYEVDEEKLARLRAKLAEADASFERGEGIEVTNVGEYVESVMNRVHERIKAEMAQQVRAAS